MKSFFATNSYQTPANTPRFMLDKVVPNGRYYFFSRYIGALVRARWRMAHGHTAHEEQAYRAYDIFKSIEGCGGRFHLTGLEHVQNCQGPVLLISNHMSSLEGNLFPCLLAPLLPISFVIKASLLKYPIFGPVLGACDPVVVSRVNPREDLQAVMAQGQTLLGRGASIVIFPQSTRTTLFEPEKFNSLGVKLARKANVKILPVALKTDFWRNGRSLRDFGPLDRSQTIHFAFGEPFAVGGNTKTAHHHVVEFIQNHLTTWS